MYKLLLLAFAASASALSFQGGCAPVIASRASAVGALFVAEPSCVRRAGVVEMAVPKKRQSKMKTRQRKANVRRTPRAAPELRSCRRRQNYAAPAVLPPLPRAPRAPLAPPARLG